MSPTVFRFNLTINWADLQDDRKTSFHCHGKDCFRRSQCKCCPPFCSRKYSAWRFRFPSVIFRVTRIILDILYSAQHGNQHKDAFAWIMYHDPCCEVYMIKIHVVRNQIRRMLVNERPRDISLARLRDLTCRVYQSVKQRRKNSLGFSNNIWLEDKSI